MWLCTNQLLRWGLPGTGLSWAPSQARGPPRRLTCSLLQFSQQEEKRQKSERLQQQQKHESQTRDMAAQCESNMGELQQLQVLPFCPAPEAVSSLGAQRPSKRGKESEAQGGMVSILLLCVTVAKSHHPPRPRFPHS